MQENNIKVLYRDGHPLEFYDTVSQATSSDILVPLAGVEKGDKLTLVTQNEDFSQDSYRESLFLSPKEKRLFQNVVLEAEIEFIREESSPNQWIEFITRGVNKWDKNYTIDECYIFGYKNGDFYFGKRSHHEEGDRSYSYKQLFDLTATGDDTRKYFQPITDEQKEELQIVNDLLDYNQKYIFRCEIIGDLVRLQIRNVTKTLTQYQDYKWITIFEDVNIRQSIDDITNVTLDIEGSISVFEPFSVIEKEGIFGFSTPNTHLKVYRFMVENKDDIVIQDQFTDEEFSREVSSEFSMSMNEFEPMKLNAVIPGEELKEAVVEHYDIEGNRVPISSSVNTEDITSLELNNITVNKEEIFNGENIDFKQPLSETHRNNKLSVVVDLDQTEHYGQKELFFDVEFETNGTSDSFDVPTEYFEVLERYPNAKLGDVLIEIDSNIVKNDFNVVGLQEDLPKFIDNKKLNELFDGRKIYMETDIRGTDSTIELGSISSNNLTFNIQEQYSQPSGSYEAIWNYNMANFVNQLVIDVARFATSDNNSSQEATITSINSLSEILTSVDISGGTFASDEISQSLERLVETLTNAMFTTYDVSIGEAVVDLPEELVNYILDNDPSPDFVVNDTSGTEALEVFKDYFRKGVDPNRVKVLCYFAQNVGLGFIRQIVRFVKMKDTRLDDILIEYMDQFENQTYQPYLDFRGVWLRDIQFNSVISDTGVINRKFYQSVKKEEYFFQDKQLNFTYTPKVSKKIKLRIFYDLTFVLTNSYQPEIVKYPVPDSTKKLSSSTNNEKGVKGIVEFLDPQTVDIRIKNNVPFVVVPKSQNEYNDELFLDLQYCVPYVGDRDTVVKNAKVPLKKVKKLLNNDFENSRYGEIYPYTQNQDTAEMPTYCVEMSGSISGIGGISGVVADFCFKTGLDRECFIATSMVDEFSVYTTPITTYQGTETRDVFDEWQRDVDILDSRTDTISGSWGVLFVPDLVPYYIERESSNDYYIPPIVYPNTILGSDILGGPLSSGISGISATSLLTLGLSGALIYSYDYPRNYPLEDGLFGDRINEDFALERFYSPSFYALFEEFDGFPNVNVVGYGVNVPVIELGSEFIYSISAAPVYDPIPRSLNPYIKQFGDLDKPDDNYLPRKDIMDKLYNVANWFTLEESKLGDYYRDVIDTIIEMKSDNRYTGFQQDLDNDASPFNLNNWFDGYYTGKRAPFYDLFTIPTHRFDIDNNGEIEIISNDTHLISNRVYSEIIGGYHAAFGIGGSSHIDYVFSEDQDEYRLEKEEGSSIMIKSPEHEYIFSVDVGTDKITSTQWTLRSDSGSIDVYGSNDGLITNNIYLFTMHAPNGSIPTRYDYRYYSFYTSPVAHTAVGDSNEYIIEQIKFFKDDFDISKIDPRLIHFGRYYGNPWGYENSKKQIIEQTKNTLESKFPDHDIYYADMTNILYAEKRVEKGEDYNVWDTAIYRRNTCVALDPITDPDVMGIGGTNTSRYINNPYIDPKIQSYSFDRDIIENGILIFDKDNLSTVTTTRIEYAKDNTLAVDTDTIVINVNSVGKKLVKGRDAFWTYGVEMNIKPEVLKDIPVGTTISVEYEYTMNGLTENNNTPSRISQRVVLGRVNGNTDQIFLNPQLALRQENVILLNIHRMWLDNIDVTDYQVIQSGEKEFVIDMKLPEMFQTIKQVGVVYRDDNYIDLKEKNKFVQKFIATDQVPWFWVPFTRDDNGYVKKENTTTTFIVDNSKYDKDSVFHINDINTDEIKTSDISFGGELIRPIQYGFDDEDIIQLNTLKRKNNFVLSFDFIYDEDTERELMRFDIFLKGKFVTIKGKQQLTDYYALVFGLDKGISLISRRILNNSTVEEVVLAQIQDVGAILKRGKFYTVKVALIKNNFNMYFNERNQEEKYYFGTHLQFGHESNNIELVAEQKFNDLNVIYKDPEYFVDGDRIALKALTPKINFANFSIELHDPSNLTFGNPFVINNYDDIVSGLKQQFKLEGELVSIKKLITGFEYVQIGDSILSRRVDGQFVLHNMVVDKFETSEDKCFIQEKVNTTSPMTVINVYEEGFKLVQNIIVNGKQLANESFVSFLAETNQKATNIEKIDGKLFITVDDITPIEDDWVDLGATWEEYYAPWNLY